MNHKKRRADDFQLVYGLLVNACYTYHCARVECCTEEIIFFLSWSGMGKKNLPQILVFGLSSLYVWERINDLNAGPVCDSKSRSENA